MKRKFNNAVGPQVHNSKDGKSALIPGLVLLTLVGGFFVATQYFAHTFEYHATLGGHAGFVYPPWRILQWLENWNQYYPHLFMQAGYAGMMVTAAGLLAVLGVKKMVAQKASLNPYSHGSARWAEREDIQAAGLLPRNRSLLAKMRGIKAQVSAGVYVGGWVGEGGITYYLRHNGPEHILCYAPTRAGKGVSLIVPTLLSWPDSTVITDLKGELWALTSGWRQRHANNKVLRFEPAALHGSAHWNPLDEIRVGTENEVGDVQNLSTLIVDPDGKGLETHWQKSAQSLLVGVILHVLYKPAVRPPSLADIDALITDPERDTRDLWVEMHQVDSITGANHRLISSTGKDMLDRPDDEAGSVLSSVKSYLSLYRDPVVRENIGDSHFRILDLMNYNSPLSLYIVTKPTDKARLRPLIRILLNMIVRLLADRIEFVNGRAKSTYKHRLLMMLDEFPSLGKLEILHESLAYLAGYGIKCYLICQDISQLKAKSTGYGPDESITSNCHIQIAFPPNRVETAEHLSKLIGQTTITKTQMNENGKQTTRTMQEVQRSLLTIDECLRMPGPIKGERDGEDVIEKPGDMIVYAAGFPAIYGKQPLYFQEPIFQARAEIPAPIQSDRLI
ncbi:MAG: type IV secretory system conjugative DNA transfer family protein [Nitrosospira sp.]